MNIDTGFTAPALRRGPTDLSLGVNLLHYETALA
jgi:hypothetical protein